MEYKGPLYAKVAGKYIPLEATAAEYDALTAEVIRLRHQLAVMGASDQIRAVIEERDRLVRTVSDMQDAAKMALKTIKGDRPDLARQYIRSIVEVKP